MAPERLQPGVALASLDLLYLNRSRAAPFEAVLTNCCVDDDRAGTCGRRCCRSAFKAGIFERRALLITRGLHVKGGIHHLLGNLAL